MMETGRVCGVRMADGREFSAGAVVLTTGTFLRGLIHIGETPNSSGKGRRGACNGFIRDPRAAWIRA